MAKDKLTDYDSTASGNLDVGGISVAEGMLPSGVNNAIREQMSHLADFAAGSSGVDVLKLQDDTDTNSIKLQAPASVTATTTFTLPDGDGASGQTMITDGAGTLSWAAPYGNRNLIINGAMQVAQRGTSGTSNADIYTVDRFAVGHGSPVNAMTFEQSTDTPDNFKNSLKITAGTGASASTTGYAILRQAIEGQNMAHLGFGTSAAEAIVLSFHVKSSLTGTFGVSIRNQAGTRGYGGTYVINSANTWEYKTVAIPADTGGTWPTDSGIGLHIMWDLGAGSNYDIAAGSWTDSTNIIGVESTVKLTETTNATWQITGVQLEVGEQATPFEHEDFGTTLIKCKRYYEHSYAYGTSAGTATASGMSGGGITGVANNSHAVRHRIRFDQVKCKAPTMTAFDSAGNSGKCNMPDTSTNIGQNFFDITTISFTAENNGVVTTDGRHYLHYVADAEL